MKVCAITSYLPSPLDTGDSLRIFGLLGALAEGNELTAACVLRPDSSESDVERLTRQVSPTCSVVPFKLDRHAGTMDARSRLVRVGKGIKSAAPPQMFSSYSSELEQFLRREGARFDVVVLIGEPAGLYAKSVPPHVRVVWDKANVLTTSFALAFRRSRTLRFRMHAAVNVLPSYLYERRVIRRADAVWVTSSDEGRRLESAFKVAPDAVIPSTVVDSHDHTVATQATSPNVVWLSSFGYPPNWDGLRRYLEHSADELAVAGLRLRVIGKGATARQQEWLRACPVVDYLGYQDDLAAACEGVRGAVVPIWVGAGVKLKTLTLMQLGVPVAATEQAMEGIPHENAIVVSDDPRVLTRALARMTDRESRAARSRALEFLGGEGGAESMRRKVRDAVSRLG